MLQMEIVSLFTCHHVIPNIYAVIFGKKKFDRDGHHELSFFGKELCEDDLLLFSNKFGVT